MAKAEDAASVLEMFVQDGEHYLDARFARMLHLF